MYWSIMAKTTFQAEKRDLLHCHSDKILFNFEQLLSDFEQYLGNSVALSHHSPLSQQWHLLCQTFANLSYIIDYAS